jgi:hypothetical protein
LKQIHNYFLSNIINNLLYLDCFPMFADVC